MENSPIKILIKNKCPHCGKEVLVEVESQVPVVKSILSPSDIEESKKYVVVQLKKHLDDETITQEEYKDAVEWINSEDTVFGPDDTETVINSIIYAKPDDEDK